MPGVIRVAGVTKRFGDKVAVDDVTCVAFPGEILGLLGPNAAGKSTLIRMIMNILAPDSGRIDFDDHPLAESDKDRIGYLPEERGLYKRQTVTEVLQYLADLKGTPPQIARPRIMQWLRRFDLEGAAGLKVEALSKGMAQKVQFISTVVHDPQILFFDEPFSGIDPVSMDILREAISELARSGKTVMFSTHLMEQAERICHRVLILDGGKQVLAGPLREVKARHGSNMIHVEFDGDLTPVRSSALVNRVVEYPRYVEIEPAEAASPDGVLRLLVEHVAVRRFEIVEPSLHNIFVKLLAREKGVLP